jgi:hypothetical protein
MKKLVFFGTVLAVSATNARADEPTSASRARSSYSARAGGLVELQAAGGSVSSLAFSWDADSGEATWTLASASGGETEEKTFKTGMRGNHQLYGLPSDDYRSLCGASGKQCRQYKVYYVHPQDKEEIYTSRFGDGQQLVGWALGPAGLETNDGTQVSWLPRNHPDASSLYCVAKQPRQKQYEQVKREKTEYYDERYQDGWDTQTTRIPTNQYTVTVSPGQVTLYGNLALITPGQMTLNRLDLIQTTQVPRYRTRTKSHTRTWYEWVEKDQYLGYIWTTERPR